LIVAKFVSDVEATVPIITWLSVNAILFGFLVDINP